MTAIIRNTPNVPRLTPNIDLLERENEFVVRLDLPGADPEAVDVTLERDLLTVSAPLEMSTPDGLKLEHAEFGAAGYLRQLRVADDIDRDGIQADWRHGVLELRLPRSESSKPRRIAIRHGE